MFKRYKNTFRIGEIKCILEAINRLPYAVPAEIQEAVEEVTRDVQLYIAQKNDNTTLFERVALNPESVKKLRTYLRKQPKRKD